MQNDFDILIVGGGMVGTSLACALRYCDLRVALVEPVAPDDAAQASFDMRAIALAQGSRRIFDGLGVWSGMVAAGVTSIRHIHVSDRGHFGSVRLHAAEEGVEALGYVAEAGVLGRVLNAALDDVSNVQLFRPARLGGLEQHADRIVAHLHVPEGDCQVSARLLVAADGGRSTVRDLLGANTFRVGYGQSAVIAYVTTDRSHDGWAYERFTDTGPLAMLPCRAPISSAEEARSKNHRWSLVWTVRDEQVEEVLGLDDDTFLARLQTRLGHRAGRLLETSHRQSYPLVLQYVRDQVRERVAFIGNAAHTIHPVGGQGFNLGLRDVAVLAEVVAEAARDGRDPGSAEILKAYSRWRRPDHLRVLGMTDGLARAFSSVLPPFVQGRNLGLLAMDLLPPARRLFARQAMGLIGRQPRLARGLSLG